jgi:hypothetical protein
MRGPLRLRLLIATLLVSLIASARAAALSDQDPHRPACTTARCREIESFLKKHYCGESPFGNGPEDGCDIKSVKSPQAGVQVIADYRCEWSEKKEAAECQQSGQAPPAVRALLVGQLHRLGLPANANGQTYFTVWKSAHSGWSIAVAYYSHTVGSDAELCEVVAILDDSSHLIVLRKLPFQKTDVDVPDVTQWVPLDIANVEGDGSEEVILEGDAYENHWLQVVSIHDGAVQTIFSGLGYYL